MPVKVYEGKFGYERLLFDADELFQDENFFAPQFDKGQLIFYNDEVYVVMYSMIDVMNMEYSVFVHIAIEGIDY